ncbi:interferon gamma receptor 1 isoform X2 [Rhinatrema bivittatum]|uniref:interferon gamma receptor 1 isoform X2 n=1 Tax=Rhinatrema bivittatum TaxID=194408 RepID=UPI001127648E|nr:interferon gamma receptor 1 isoform X2 [Rhinatrema bivittatum]
MMASPAARRLLAPGSRLLLLLLLLQGSVAAPSASWGQSQPSSADTVPVPTELVIKSYNFNTTLYWNYSNTTSVPYFSVEVYDFRRSTQKDIETCQNISHYFCDLSEEVYDPSNFYTVMVKAAVESKESSHAVIEDYSLRLQGKIGPPELKITEDDPDIIVEILHPVTPYKREDHPDAAETVRDIYEDFTYSVFERKSGNEYKPTRCDIWKCIVKIPHLSTEGLYLSAQGKSESWAIDGERSEETRFNVTSKASIKDLRYRVYVILAFVVFVVLLIIVASILIVKLLKEKNIQLPKSLVSVVRNFSPHVTNESEQTSTCKLISTAPVTPVSENESLMHSEESAEVQAIPNAGECIKKDKSLEISGKNEEERIEGSCGEMTPDITPTDHVKAKGTYSDTIETELQSITSDPEPSKVCPEGSTEVKPLAVITNCNPSFGYNKPHVPLDLLIEVAEGETVLGYRVTPEAGD